MKFKFLYTIKFECKFKDQAECPKEIKSTVHSSYIMFCFDTDTFIPTLISNHPSSKDI